jgi:predicted alpha/beta-hydrolase family hydrolase
MSLLDDIAGVAHQPRGAPTSAVVLTHGAGGSRESPLLVALCDEWSRRGWLAIRYDLPYRRRRATGPPSGSSAADQSGIAEALEAARTLCPGPLIAGGHSYGGRLTSMLVAARHGIADELTLFSYPLHPPGKPERLRTEHFGSITVPTVFTHGSSDPFGSLEELRAAVTLISAPTAIVEVRGTGHDLGFSRGTNVPDVPAPAVEGALNIGPPHWFGYLLSHDRAELRRDHRRSRLRGHRRGDPAQTPGL